MTPDALRELIAFGAERSGVEFKGARPRTDLLFLAKVVRAALGMSNRRDGGLIVLGVDEVAGQLTPVGLDAEALASWRHDLIADQFARYADPPLAFTTESVELDGKSFVVLSISEFSDAPTVCRNSYESVLRTGACYVRPRRKPETTEIPTYADMKDLLDLALSKNLRRYVETAQEAGLVLSRAGAQPSPSPSDADLFKAQLQDLQ